MEKVKERITHYSLYVTALLKWLAVGALVGGVGGFVGALFHLGVDCATNVRLAHPWILYLLPLGGVVIALLGIIALFCSPKIRTGLNIAVALNALLSLAVPTVLIGVCKGAMMHCHMVTRPTLIVIGILALLFAVVAIYLDSRPVKR